MHEEIISRRRESAVLVIPDIQRVSLALGTAPETHYYLTAFLQ